MTDLDVGFVLIFLVLGAVAFVYLAGVSRHPFTKRKK
jgi:hypothetical protein